MIWMAFFMMAAQAGVVLGGPNTTPGVSAQQRQDLSKFDFQGAGRVLAAQTAQNAAKPASTTPIPQLRVPTLVTTSPTASSTNAGAALHNSEVPPDWKGPTCRVECRCDRCSCCRASTRQQHHYAYTWCRWSRHVHLRARNAGVGLRSAPCLRR